MRRIEKVIILLLLAWLSVSSFAEASEVKDAEPKRVLAILFYREGLPWSDLIVQSLRTNLVSKSPYPVELNIEYADRERYPDDTYLQKLIGFYRHKYFHFQMHLVIGVGDEAADILVGHGEELFGKIPMVMVSANPKILQRDFLKSHMTSLLWGPDIQGNVELIKELLPKTRHLFIVSGSSLTDREAEKLTRAALRKYESQFEINYFKDINKAVLLEKVAQLPENSALLYLAFTRDAKGTAFVPREMLSVISEKANAPVFGIIDTYLGYGIVGGSLLSAEVQGKRFADIAARVLRGEPPLDIYPARVLNHLRFDWRQLKRWGIPEDRLPPGSIVQFKTMSFWNLYRWYIVAVILLILIQSGLVSFLWRQRALRRRTEVQHKERLRFEEMLSGLSARFMNLPPDRVDSQIAHELKKLAEFLEVDRVTVFEVSETNQMLRAVQSYTRSGVAPAPSQIEYDQLTWAKKKLFSGETVFFSNPDDLPAEAGTEKEYFHSQGVRSAVAIPFASDDESTPGLLTLAMVRHRHEWSDGLIRRYQLVAEIIANALARKQSEKALLQSKNFNRSTLDSLHYHIAVLDREGNILDVNESWKRFGRENDADLDRIANGVNYLEVCRRSSVGGDELAQSALEGIQSVLGGSREHFVLEYPCDSPSENRWFLMRAIPFSGRKGGSIISHIDITERKLAEFSLRNAYTEIEQLKNRLEAETAYLQEEIKLEHNFEGIIGNSAAIQYVLYKIEQVAATDTAVLVLGETGSGKELVARAIHNHSLRKTRALLKVNCATLQINLIESELFGHERGAFTGAHTRQIGRFEVADGGGIFLDEIGELPLEQQTKLLRVLQDGEFERVGSSRTIKVDVRVIAATNRNLEAEVRKGRFREDLFYRLNVFPITVPPLRDRREDIPLLTKSFVDKSSKRMGKSIEHIPERVMQKLHDYPWPGNVRELENVLERAVINSSGPKLRLADALAGPPHKEMPTHLKSLQAIERDHIIRVLEETDWRIDGPKGAALILDMNPSTLRSRLHKLGIKKP